MMDTWDKDYNEECIKQLESISFKQHAISFQVLKIVDGEVMFKSRRELSDEYGMEVTPHIYKGSNELGIRILSEDDFNKDKAKALDRLKQKN